MEKKWTSIDLSHKLSLTRVGNINYYKSVYHPILGNLQKKSVSSPFNWLPRYILFLAKLKRSGRLFLEGAGRWVALWEYHQEYLAVIKDERVCPFVKIKTILHPHFYLLDPLTNKHCRAWSSTINLWIDSSTCEKYTILLSARERSNNYVRAFKRKCFGEYDTVTLTMLYLKVLHDMVSQNS